MMLPDIPYKTRTKKVMQTQFGGLDRRKAAGNGTIESMRDMSSDAWPMICRRKPRTYFTALEGEPRGFFANGGTIFVVDKTAGGAVLKCASYKPDSAWIPSLDMLETVGTLPGSADSRRHFAALGERVVIWPDKVIVYYDTTTVPAGWRMESLGAGTAPGDLTGGTIGDGTYAGVQAELNTLYHPNASFDWTTLFKEGDGLTISGTSGRQNDMTVVVREIEGNQLRFNVNTFAAEETLSNAVTVTRAVPDLDYICSNENRVWGCKDDTIWCCKPGDPRNWYVFDGISTSSWFVQSGTAGRFTGCVSYGGYPVFFKEDQIIKVYGNRATNYELSTAPQPGVIDGADRSLAVVGSALMYLSRDGFVQYTGSYPRKIDAALDTRYVEAVGGNDRMKYYVSAKQADGTEEMLVYDIRYGCWHQETGTAAYMAYSYGLVSLMHTSLGNEEAMWWIVILGDPVTLPPEYAGTEVPYYWVNYVEFGDWDMQSFDSKYPTRVWLRVDGTPDARLSSEDPSMSILVAVSYDGAEFESAGQFFLPEARKSAYLPLPIRRCDHFRLRITGVLGAWTLRAIEMELYAGPESRIP